jgi:predicted N-acetyltransferase YhbS
MRVIASERRLHLTNSGAELEPSRTNMVPAVNAPRTGTFIVEPARAGDHLAILYFLQQVFGGPTSRDFQAQQDEPGYTPAQRLVIRQGSRIVAHIRLVPGVMQVPGGLLPVARLCEMGVAPEYRGRGWGSALLREAERIALQRGYVMLVGRSSHAALFARFSWFPCGMHTYSFADPREILAELDRRRPVVPPLPIEPLKPGVEQIRVRRWKQTEFNALRRIYRDTFSTHAGPLTRSDAQWRWLIQRDAYDSLHVAVMGKERIVLDELQAHILGYAFVKGDRILEMGSSENHPEAQQALLTRVCRDAIERSATPVRFDAPANHPVHELIHAAGGQHVQRECDVNQWRLAKVLDWPRFVKITLAQATTELVIETHAHGRAWQRFIVEQGKVSCENLIFHPERPADVLCSEPLLAQLLLGHGKLQEAMERMWIQFSTDDSEATFRRLLPQPTLWMPALEELLA